MKNRKLLPDVDILHKVFQYNPRTGILTRKVCMHKGLIGKSVGWVRSGYLLCKVEGRKYAVHRIVWKMYHLEEPPHTLDHINRDRQDNRICNLRKSNGTLNAQNTERRSKPRYDKDQDAWHMQINFDGIPLDLGYYVTEDLAIKTRDKRIKMLCRIHGLQNDPTNIPY